MMRKQFLTIKHMAEQTAAGVDGSETAQR
jgi:hypothetical protein